MDGLFNFLVTLLPFLVVMTVAEVLCKAPKSRIEIADAMNAWFERLLDEHEAYFELVHMGVVDFRAWHESQGYSLLRDWLTWQRWKHRRGRFLIRLRMFHAIDNRVRP